MSLVVVQIGAAAAESRWAETTELKWLVIGTVGAQRKVTNQVEQAGSNGLLQVGITFQLDVEPVPEAGPNVRVAAQQFIVVSDAQSFLE